jgi:hypothetical protein
LVNEAEAAATEMAVLVIDQRGRRVGGESGGGVAGHGCLQRQTERGKK